MAPSNRLPELSKRERQIMDLIYARGEATVNQVRDHLPNPPSYSAVRALVRILEGKGHLRHRREGFRYVYRPTKSHRTAGKSALSRIVQTFYGGDVHETFSALLNVSESHLSLEQIDRIRKAIAHTKEQGR